MHYTSPSLKPETCIPKIHFSPEHGWMSDPNGLVYYKGEYDLFYQHTFEGSVWVQWRSGNITSKIKKLGPLLEDCYNMGLLKIQF